MNSSQAMQFVDIQINSKTNKNQQLKSGTILNYRIRLKSRPQCKGRQRFSAIEGYAALLLILSFDTAFLLKVFTT